jgi:hypothetical protein
VLHATRKLYSLQWRLTAAIQPRMTSSYMLSRSTLWVLGRPGSDFTARAVSTNLTFTSSSLDEGEEVGVGLRGRGTEEGTSFERGFFRPTDKSMSVSVNFLFPGPFNPIFWWKKMSFSSSNSLENSLAHLTRYYWKY